MARQCCSNEGAGEDDSQRADANDAEADGSSIWDMARSGSSDEGAGEVDEGCSEAMAFAEAVGGMEHMACNGT